MYSTSHIFHSGDGGKDKSTNCETNQRPIHEYILWSKDIANSHIRGLAHTYTPTAFYCPIEAKVRKVQSPSTQNPETLQNVRYQHLVNRGNNAEQSYFSEEEVNDSQRLTKFVRHRIIDDYYPVDRHCTMC